MCNYAPAVFDSIQNPKQLVWLSKMLKNQKLLLNAVAAEE